MDVRSTISKFNYRCKTFLTPRRVQQNLRKWELVIGRINMDRLQPIHRRSKNTCHLYETWFLRFRSYQHLVPMGTGLLLKCAYHTFWNGSRPPTKLNRIYNLSGMECCDTTKKFVDQNKFAVPKNTCCLYETLVLYVIVPTNILSRGDRSVRLKCGYYTSWIVSYLTTQNWIASIIPKGWDVGS